MFQRISSRIWFLYAAFLVAWVVSIVATGAGYNIAWFDWNFANSGAFGDSFGPISAVMASLAAAAAFETLQDARLDARKSEIREVKRERDESLRSFENTFFNLLRSFENLVEQTDVERSGDHHLKRGRDCYAFFYKMILSRRANVNVSVEDAFDYIFKRYINDLAHYFRYLYNLIVFVDESKSTNKYFYVKILRATLSESELSLIALNAMFHPEGKIHLRKMVEKYALLNNISEEAISQLRLHEFFSEGAFKGANVQEEKEDVLL